MSQNNPKSPNETLPMLSSVDIQSSVAVYLQIENHVRFAISAGRLKPGAQLPSMFELSKQLNVNQNTVAKAYRDLEIMGLVYTRRGMGVYVNKGTEAACRADCRRRVIERAHEVVGEAKAAGMTHEEVLNIVGKSLTYDQNPYGPTPPALFQTGKSNRNAK